MNCETCGQPFSPKRTNKANRYCSHDCYWAARKAGAFSRPLANDKNGRMVRRPGHPIAPPSGIVALARLTLYDKIGGGPHPCHWCGAAVNWGRGLAPGVIVVDHLDWDRLNDAPDNLVPSCNVCNSHRRKQGGAPLIGEDEPVYTYQRGNGEERRERGVYRYCAICGTRFVKRLSEKRPNKGLYCSRSCARRA